jgi:hypothetical protein
MTATSTASDVYRTGAVARFLAFDRAYCSGVKSGPVRQSVLLAASCAGSFVTSTLWRPCL